MLDIWWHHLSLLYSMCNISLILILNQAVFRNMHLKLNYDRWSWNWTFYKGLLSFWKSLLWKYERFLKIYNSYINSLLPRKHRRGHFNDFNEQENLYSRWEGTSTSNKYFSYNRLYWTRWNDYTPQIHKSDTQVNEVNI